MKCSSSAVRLKDWYRHIAQDRARFCWAKSANAFVTMVQDIVSMADDTLLAPLHTLLQTPVLPPTDTHIQETLHRCARPITILRTTKYQYGVEQKQLRSMYVETPSPKTPPTTKVLPNCLHKTVIRGLNPKRIVETTTQIHCTYRIPVLIGLEPDIFLSDVDRPRDRKLWFTCRG